MLEKIQTDEPPLVRLTVGELKAYLQGTLSANEKERVEKIIANSIFYQRVLEGIEIAEKDCAAKKPAAKSKGAESRDRLFSLFSHGYRTLLEGMDHLRPKTVRDGLTLISP